MYRVAYAASLISGLVLALVLGGLMRSASGTANHVAFSLVYRLAIANEDSVVKNIADWQIRLPLGVNSVDEKSVKNTLSADDLAITIPGRNISPFATININISFAGNQSYPDLADELYSSLVSDNGFTSSYGGPLYSHDQNGIQSLFSWLDENIAKVPFQKQAFSLAEIDTERRGDCTEFTLYAYYALRASGYNKVIPVVGYMMPEGGSRSVSSANFHAWLLVYMDEKWLVVDPLYKKIEAPSSEYIVMDIMKEGMNSELISSAYPNIHLGRKI